MFSVTVSDFASLRMPAPDGAATRSCDPCDWCDSPLGSWHGDPYVFPAGVAEQEHVPSSRPPSRRAVLEHPIPEYRQEPGPASKRERRRMPARGGSKRPLPAPRGRSATGPVRSPALRRPRPGRRRRLAGHRPRPRRRRPLDRAARPVTSTPSTVATVPGCSSFGLAMVVAAAVWWQLPGAVMDFIPHRGRRRGRQGRLARPAASSSTSAGATCATPSATGPPAARSSAGPPSRFGVLGIVHIANGSPQPELGDPATSSRPGERSAS